MNRRNLALGLLAIATLWAGGCASGPAPVVAKTKQSVALEGGTQRTEIRTKVAEELTLVLPRVEEPGHVWRLVSHDPRMLQQKTEITASESDAGPTIVFVAQRAVSRTGLRFLLVPAASQREAEPIDSQVVTVTIER